MDEHIGDDGEGDALGDAVEQRHGNDAEEGWDYFGVIFLSEFEMCHIAEGKEADEDERRGCGKGRNGREDGRDQHGHEEEDGHGHGGKAGAATGGHTGRRFHEGGCRGCAQHGTGRRGYGIGQQGRADARHTALSVQHTGFCTNADEAAERVEDVHEEQRDDDNGKVEQFTAADVHIETLAEGQADFGKVRHGEGGQEREMPAGRIHDVQASELAHDAQQPCDEYAHEDGAGYILNIKA